MNGPSTRLMADGLPPVIVIGSGGHASVAIELLRLLGREILFATDVDPHRFGHATSDVVIQGPDELIYDYPPDTVELVNGLGSIGIPRARAAIFQRFTGDGYRFATLVHPRAIVSPSVQLGQGVHVMAGAVLQCAVVVGDNSIVNTAASVDHDCRIGAHVHIAPGVTLSGGVVIGDTVHIGCGASVIQGIAIGDQAVVAAGATVIRHVESGAVVAGVPARPLKSRSTVRDKETDRMTILLCAAGRRVALFKLLQESALELGRASRVVASDVTRNSPVMQYAELSHLLPRYSDPKCLDVMLSVCREYDVKLIVPTIDPDLPFLAEHRHRFEDCGARPMISSVAAIAIANDKLATNAWLSDNGFPTVRQIEAHDLLRDPAGWSFPLFAKPRGGSASIGARKVRSLDDLRLLAQDVPYLVQEIAPGVEYTVDVFVDRFGKCRCAVPRRRVETRSGEVSKGITVRCEPVAELASRVVERLPGAFGVLNVQIFHDVLSGQLNVIEINPRFGGGYPLTHQAGAPMARWMLEEALELPSTATNDTWQENLLMLRYDEAVFIPNATLDTKSQ